MKILKKLKKLAVVLLAVLTLGALSGCLVPPPHGGHHHGHGGPAPHGGPHR